MMILATSVHIHTTYCMHQLFTKNCSMFNVLTSDLLGIMNVCCCCIVSIMGYTGWRDLSSVIIRHNLPVFLEATPKYFTDVMKGNTSSYYIWNIFYVVVNLF